MLVVVDGTMHFTDPAVFVWVPFDCWLGAEATAWAQSQGYDRYVSAFGLLINGVFKDLDRHSYEAFFRQQIRVPVENWGLPEVDGSYKVKYIQWDAVFPFARSCKRVAEEALAGDRKRVHVQAPRNIY